MNRSTIIAAVLICGVAASLGAEEKNPEKTAAKLITPAVQRGIERGLKWLVSQQRDDGSFNDGSYRGNVAVCAWPAWR